MMLNDVKKAKFKSNLIFNVLSTTILNTVLFGFSFLTDRPTSEASLSKAPEVSARSFNTLVLITF